MKNIGVKWNTNALNTMKEIERILMPINNYWKMEFVRG